MELARAGGGRDRPTEDHRRQHEPGDERRAAHHHLNVHRQEGGQADHRHAAEQRRSVGRRHDPAGPQREGDHRIGSAPFLAHEQRCAGQTYGQRSGWQREPPRSCFGQHHHEGGDGHREQHRTRRIDAALLVGHVFAQEQEEPRRRSQADRHIDPEYPRPGHVLDDEPTGERTGDRRHAPDARQPALHLAALLRRIEIADDGHRHRLDRPRAQALHQPEGDQRR